MLYSCCTNFTLCYHPVLMEIILVVMFQSLLVYIYPCCPTYYSSYIYIIICDQVTVVTRQSKVATGLAEKNSLTANTNSSHCHDIYIYTVVIFCNIFKTTSQSHYSSIDASPVLKIGQHKKTFSTSWKFPISCAQTLCKTWKQIKFREKKNLANDI